MPFVIWSRTHIMAWGGASVLKAAGRCTKSSPSWAKPITRFIHGSTPPSPQHLQTQTRCFYCFSAPSALSYARTYVHRAGQFPAASSLQTRVSHFPSCSSADGGLDRPSAPLRRRPRPGGCLNEAYWHGTGGGGGQSSCFDKSSLAFINHLVLRGVKDL